MRFRLAILSHADQGGLRRRDLGAEAEESHRHGLIDGRAKERDGEAADLAAVGRAAAFTSAARPLNDLAGLFEKDAAGFSENCPPRRAHEKRDLQLLLKRMNLSGNRGLCDVAALRRAAKTALLGACNEVAQL